MLYGSSTDWMEINLYEVYAFDLLINVHGFGRNKCLIMNWGL